MMTWSWHLKIMAREGRMQPLHRNCDSKKFIEAGYPVVKGTARFRSKDVAYLGNGDTIEFKAA
jgi:hypothetical protein